MGKEPTYEELAQRIRDLEQEAIKRDEAEKDASERYIALFNRSLFSVFVHDLDGNFLDANDTALNLLGYTKNEIPSLNFASLLDENQLPMVFEILEEIKRTGSHKRPVEYRLRRKDGSFVWMETESNVIFQQGTSYVIQGVARDITSRKQSQEALKESEERFRAIFEQAVVGVAQIVASTGHFVRINQRYCDIVGYTREEMEQRAFQDITHPDDLQPDLNNMMLLLEGKIRKFSMEKRYYRKDGSIVWVNLTVSPMWQVGEQPSFHIAVVEDITDRKVVQEALGISHDVLEITNRHTEMTPMLRESVTKVKNFTGCEAVGIRVLDESGNIPYQAYEGFSQTFYESESPLKIKSDQCVCINVIKGRVDSKLPFYTEAGSFHVNGTTRFLAAVSEQEKGRTRNICNKFGYESVVLVPIRLGHQILGLIHLADSKEDKVPRDVVRVLERVAMQLGAALKRVWAEEDLRNAHAELEKRVEERTSELVLANQRLKSSEKDLRHLSSRLLSVQEKERKRIAREIHDSIGQSLNAVKFIVENSLQEMEGEKFAKGTKSLESVIPVIQAAVEEVRRIEKNLRPLMLDDLGLSTTISWHCREFEKIYSGIHIKKQIDIEENDVPDYLKIVIFRILQEASNNISKHSQATVVDLTLKRAGPRIEMTVSDNGVGFELGDAVTRNESERGSGLISMKERTELSEGLFLIDTSEGTGTTICASWEC
jgi:PAS domain S-box-containing protein